MEYPVDADRRSFLRRGAMGAGAVWMLSLQELAARGSHRGPVVTAGSSPYGPIRPQKDETTGLELLQLPEGFRYWSYSWTGEAMSDGVRCPNLHDGMAVVDEWRGSDGEPASDLRDDARKARGGKVVLVRNHEGGVGAPYLAGRPDITYAPAGAASGNGGTTNLIFDTRTAKWEASWSSLAGTVRNCAGGVTPWGTWLTCEETDAAATAGCSTSASARATSRHSSSSGASRTKR